MTIINPNSDTICKAELDDRFWLNQTPLPRTPDDIYNIPCRDKMFKVKKAEDYPFGSVAGFTQEQEVIERFLYPNIDKNSLFIDVGACWGQYSLRALSLGAKVVAFEPDPRLIKGLRDNIDLNPRFDERFILYEGAVGSINGVVNIGDLEDVAMGTLDYFIDIYKPTLIKIDVEGMESYVIEGAIDMLKRYKPKLLIENHAYMGSDRTYELAERFIGRTRKMVSILTSLNYNFQMGPEVGRTYFTFCY